jgi:plasmid stabilization system protein ParE
MFRAIDSLADDPIRYPLAPEADEYGGELRQLLVGKRRSVYRVLFVIHAGSVYIFRVRHHAQDLLRPGELPNKPTLDD